MKVIGIALLLVAAGVGDCTAQVLAVPSPGRVWLGGSVGAGSGPAGAALAEVSVGVEAASSVELRGLVEGWASTGVCILRAPDSYACSARGVSGRLAIQATPVSWSRLAPFVQANGGLHARRGPGDEWTPNPVVGVGAGTRVAIVPRWAMRIEARYSWILDEEYSRLMGEELRVAGVVVGVEYGRGR